MHNDQTHNFFCLFFNQSFSGGDVSCVCALVAVAMMEIEVNQESALTLLQTPGNINAAAAAVLQEESENFMCIIWLRHVLIAWYPTLVVSISII